MRTYLRGKITLLFMTFGLLLAIPAIALADNLQDSITAGSNAKTIATTGGTPGSFENKYWVLANGSGGAGCDIPAGGNVKFKLTVPPEVTASTTDLTFTGCGDATTNTQSVTFSSDNPGLYDISAAFVSETDSAGVTTTAATADTYNENDAKLALTVAGVDSVTPANDATNVAANTDVTATFVTNTSGTTGPFDASTFKLVKDGTTTSVPAAISYNSTTKVATLNPNSDLELGTKYNATISGVTSGGVALETKNWSFTTVAPVCTNPADPTFSGTPDGSNGWYKTTPTVSASSSTSGAVVKYSNAANGTYSETAPTLNEGTTTVYAKAFSSTGSCSSAAVSNTYKVDTIAPSVDPTNVVDNVWRNSSLSQTFSSSDSGSGLANSADASFTLSASDESADASTPTVVSRTVSDVAGNSTTRSVSAKIDLTDPTITASVSPAPNANGWNNSDVTVHFTCGDALSGLSGACPDDVVLGEGADQSVTKSVTDNAGNSASVTKSNIDIDKTNPLVSLVGGPAAGGSYYFGSVPNAPTCTASDALSGLDGACSVSGYSNAVGHHTVTATAKDKAANTASESHTYDVLGWTLKGFTAPVDYDVGTTKVWNTVKGGATVPLKFEVFAGTTELTDPAVVDKFIATGVTCPGANAATDDIEITTTGGTQLRYDTTAGQFIQNWQTPKKAGSCYDVTMQTDDGTKLPAVAHFMLK